MATLPKIFRPVTQNTLMFIFGLSKLRLIENVCLLSIVLLNLDLIYPFLKALYDPDKLASGKDI